MTIFHLFLNCSSEDLEGEAIAIYTSSAWQSCLCKLERCPELTQDVPRIRDTFHTQKGLFILAEMKVENAKMADVKHTHGAIDV